MDKNYYLRMVQVSINQFSSLQFSAHRADLFKSLTPMLCLFSLRFQLSSLTWKVTMGQVQVQPGSINIGCIGKACEEFHKLSIIKHRVELSAMSTSK